MSRLLVVLLKPGIDLTEDRAGTKEEPRSRWHGSEVICWPLLEVPKMESTGLPW